MKNFIKIGIINLLLLVLCILMLIGNNYVRWSRNVDREIARFTHVSQMLVNRFINQMSILEYNLKSTKHIPTSLNQRYKLVKLYEGIEVEDIYYIELSKNTPIFYNQHNKLNYIPFNYQWLNDEGFLNYMVEDNYLYLSKRVGLTKNFMVIKVNYDLLTKFINLNSGFITNITLTTAEEHLNFINLNKRHSNLIIGNERLNISYDLRNFRVSLIDFLGEIVIISTILLLSMITNNYFLLKFYNKCIKKIKRITGKFYELDRNINISNNNLSKAQKKINSLVSYAEKLNKSTLSQSDFYNEIINVITNQKHLPQGEDLSDYSIKTIIESCINIIAPQLMSDDINIIIYNKQEAYFSTCTAIYIKIIILNILQKSILRVTESGQIKIVISKKSEKLLMKISDTGYNLQNCGIDSGINTKLKLLDINAAKMLEFFNIKIQTFFRYKKNIGNIAILAIPLNKNSDKNTNNIIKFPGF